MSLNNNQRQALAGALSRSASTVLLLFGVGPFLVPDPPLPYPVLAGCGVVLAGGLLWAALWLVK